MPCIFQLHELSNTWSKHFPYNSLKLFARGSPECFAQVISLQYRNTHFLWVIVFHSVYSSLITTGLFLNAFIWSRWRACSQPQFHSKGLGVAVEHQSELEQLEHPRSANTPAAPWLPILLIHVGSQFKTSQRPKKCQTLIFFILKKQNYTRRTF